MPGPRKPSVKAIQAYFSRELKHEGISARAVRAALDIANTNRPRDISEALQAADKLLGTHGIESIGGQDWRREPGALYLNTGDTYAGTILYDVEKNAFLLTTWGDWVEAQERKGRSFE